MFRKEANNLQDEVPEGLNRVAMSMAGSMDAIKSQRAVGTQ